MPIDLEVGAGTSRTPPPFLRALGPEQIGARNLCAAPRAAQGMAANGDNPNRLHQHIISIRWFAA